MVLAAGLFGCRAPVQPMETMEAAAWADYRAAQSEYRAARQELEALKRELGRARERVEAVRRQLAELEGGHASDSEALREKSAALEAALSRLKD